MFPRFSKMLKDPALSSVAFHRVSMGLFPSEPLIRSLTARNGAWPGIVLPGKPTSVGKAPAAETFRVDVAASSAPRGSQAALVKAAARSGVTSRATILSRTGRKRREMNGGY